MPYPPMGWRLLGLLALAWLPTAHAQVHSHPAPKSYRVPDSPHTAAAAPLPTADPAAAWRAANDTVGAFPRGHADLLRWEQAQGWTGAPADDEPPRDPLTLDAAVQHALRADAAWLLMPTFSERERHQRAQAATRVALAAQTAWIDAVAAREQSRLAERMAEAADIGHELARRMHQVGHFSAERLQREALVLENVQVRLQQARWSEQQALLRLRQRLGLADPPTALAQRLPPTLAPPPAPPPRGARPPVAPPQRDHDPAWEQVRQDAERARAALAPATWALIERALADATRASLDAALADRDPPTRRWPHAWGEALLAQQAQAQRAQQLDTDLELALAAAHHQTQRWQQTQQRLLPLAQALEDETLLRVNGMLASTWDLLAATRERLATQQASVAAARDAWLAWLDLQAVLAALPYTPRADGPVGDAATPAARGH
jgi:hypothetical protein